MTSPDAGRAVWTVEHLAAEPRWDPARIARMSGRCRGDLLGRWGENLVRRFGPAALGRVRARLAPPLDQLAAVLTARDWVPVHAQVVVTEAIADELLGGDLGALYPLLVEDTRAGLGRLELALVRGMGPARALKLGPKSFAKVYEQGACDVAVDGRRAELSFHGSPLFGHPTWRLMQLFAQRVLLELAGSPGAAVGQDGPDPGAGFRVIASW